MSYILDALNKAEKDRQQQTPAGVPSVLTQNNISPQEKGKYGLYFIITVLILLMLWMLLSQEGVPSHQVVIPQKMQIIAPISKAKSVVQIKQVKPQPTQKIEKEAIPVQEEVKSIPNIMALNSTLRNQLPPIAISAHVYSNDASKRMVIINNQVKHEQQYIDEQLQLTHITPQGIQLQYQDTDFTMTVKDQWSPF